MSTQQYYDQYGRGYREASQASYVYDRTFTRPGQRSDPYHTDARTPYGPYDPRYASRSSAFTQQDGMAASRAQVPASPGPSYDYSQQRIPSTSSYKRAAYAPTDQLSHMHIREETPQSSTPPAYYHRQQHNMQPQAQADQGHAQAMDRAQSYAQQTDSSTPSHRYAPMSAQSQGGSSSRNYDLARDDWSNNLYSSNQSPPPVIHRSVHTDAVPGLHTAPHHQLDYRPASDRPISSASGIINLYTDDASTSLDDQSSSFAPFTRAPPISNASTSIGAPRNELHGTERPRFPQQPSQRASRPLPVTPAAKHPEPAPSRGSGAGSAVTGPSSPSFYDRDDNGAETLAQNERFNTMSPHPSAWSSPGIPSAAGHSTAPSTASNAYPAPSWSPSPSTQGTPSSFHTHRTLPSFSPPPREDISATPLPAFRTPIYPQAGARSIRAEKQNRVELEQRPDGGYNQTYYIPSTDQAYSTESLYEPDSTDASRSDRGVRRQLTRSDASDLSMKPSRSHRQPLPPTPGLDSSAQQYDSLRSDYPAKMSASQYGASEYSRPRLASGGSTQAQAGSSRTAQPAVRSGAQQKPISHGLDDQRVHAQGYGRETLDALAWEPVNTPKSEGPRGPATAARSSRFEAPEWSLLSTVALLLRVNVPRGVQIKGSIDYPNSFTGKDVVSTLQELLVSDAAGSRHALVSSGDLNNIRRVALSLAKSLKSQLFFHEVDWGGKELTDDVDEVYTFLEDSLADPSSAPGDADDWVAALNNKTSVESSLQLSTGSAADGAGGKAGQLRKPVRMPDLDELPNAVFTPLTRCYSPLCNPGQRFTCYSPSCPNSASSPLRFTMADSENRAARLGGVLDADIAADQTSKKAWAEIVPPELLKSIPQTEIARQNAILETIQKEEEFLADLELLDTLFVQGLQKPSDAGDPPPLPIGPERDDFIREVFGNHRELVMHIGALVERLHIRQREENPIVQTIGDLFLRAALEWGDAYTTYLVNYPLAISRVKREMSINPRFKAFIEACRRHPAAHKHPLENFLFRPPARLQRYHLHLESILKKTEEGNHDRDSLQNAIDIINDQCKTAQAGVETAELKVKIREYAYNLSAKRNKQTVDMDLLNPERQLVHQGTVLRKPDAFDFDWTELLAILFDNYFIVVKQKRIAEGSEDDGFNGVSSSSSAGARFVLAKRPIPVEMLEVSGLTESSISRSIGLSNFHISREREARDFWPFTISHLGGKIEPVTLYAPSKAARDQWKAKLDEAIGLRTAVQDNNKVFDQQLISDDIFAIPSTLSLEPDKPVPGVDPSVFHGRVTCAVPFVTADRRRLVAVGCADGVWIGLRNDPKSLRKVLHLKYVTQCAVLESFGIFVVLADKVLISYSLEALVPTSSSSASTLRPPQKLSGNRDVLFFNVGVLKDRTLLIYMKKKANESVFRALEPVLNAPRATEGKSGSSFFGKFGKDSKNSDWFRIYKTFFIPSEAYSIQFLRSKLCIICAKGFEIMNLDSLLPGTIPDFIHANREDVRVQQLQKRVETAKPLGMYKTSDGDFLLCYDAFACYVDRLGEPTRLEQIIEWEGFPKEVAFSGNYVLAFDSRFIEVRDALTGRLVQIMRGVDLHYVSGNSTVTSSSSESAQLAGLDAEANPVIFTRRERVGGRIPFDFQRVVELSPTGPPSSHIYAPPFQRTATVLSNGSSFNGHPSGRPSVATPSNWI